MLKSNLELLNNHLDAIERPLITSQELENMTIEQIRERFAAAQVAAIAYILKYKGRLPGAPFPETNPYKHLIPFNPDHTTWIIGTFPPISYMLDDPGLNNAIPKLLPLGSKAIKAPIVPIYHGNRLSLWKGLNDDLYETLKGSITREAKRQAVIAFMNNRGINYMDVIDGCQRMMYNAEDAKLRNIIPNVDGLMNLIGQADYLTPVLIFNTSSTFGNAGLSFAHGEFKPQSKSFDIFISIAIQLGHELSFSRNGVEWYNLVEDINVIRVLFSSVVIFYLRIEKKICIAITGSSPTGRGLGSNWVYERYCEQLHPRFANSASDFVKFIYRNAVNHNLDVLWDLNEQIAELPLLALQTT